MGGVQTYRLVTECYELREEIMKSWHGICSINQSSPLPNKMSASEKQRKHTQEFTCESAIATVWQENDFVFGASYSGVLSRACFANLRASVVRATQKARVVTLHMEKALMTEHAPDIPTGVYRLNLAPAAVIVRPDQVDVWRDYADKMADLGIMRVVFLYSQRAEHRLFLDCLSGAQGRAGHQSQPAYA